MGVAEFIKNRFIDKELYISCGEISETITYNQAWSANKEFLYGVVLDVNNNVISLEVPENGIIYINCDNIVCFWEPGLDYQKSVRTSLTRRATGYRK